MAAVIEKKPTKPAEKATLTTSPAKTSSKTPPPPIPPKPSNLYVNKQTEKPEIKATATAIPAEIAVNTQAAVASPHASAVVPTPSTGVAAPAASRATTTGLYPVLPQSKQNSAVVATQSPTQANVAKLATATTPSPTTAAAVVATVPSTTAPSVNVAATHPTVIPTATNSTPTTSNTTITKPTTATAPINLTEATQKKLEAQKEYRTAQKMLEEAEFNRLILAMEAAIQLFLSDITSWFTQFYTLKYKVEKEFFALLDKCNLPLSDFESILAPHAVSIFRREYDRNNKFLQDKNATSKLKQKIVQKFSEKTKDHCQELESQCTRIRQLVGVLHDGYIEKPLGKYYIEQLESLSISKIEISVNYPRNESWDATTLLPNNQFSPTINKKHPIVEFTEAKRTMETKITDMKTEVWNLNIIGLNKLQQNFNHVIQCIEALNRFAANRLSDYTYNHCEERLKTIPINFQKVIKALGERLDLIDERFTDLQSSLDSVQKTVRKIAKEPYVPMPSLVEIAALMSQKPNAQHSYTGHAAELIAHQTDTKHAAEQAADHKTTTDANTQKNDSPATAAAGTDTAATGTVGTTTIGTGTTIEVPNTDSKDDSDQDAESDTETSASIPAAAFTPPPASAPPESEIILPIIHSAAGVAVSSGSGSGGAKAVSSKTNDADKPAIDNQAPVDSSKPKPSDA